MTRTRIILSAAILLGTASASFAMSPTGQNYRSFAGAHASTRVVPAPGGSMLTTVSPTQAELADHQSFFYRQ